MPRRHFRRIGVRSRPLPSLTLLATLCLAATPGHAQVDSREGIALQNQIYQLRQEIQLLREQIARGGGVAPAPARGAGPTGGDMVAQLLTRIDAVEEQTRQLRGRIDELQNQTQRQDADLLKKIEDIQFQLSSPPARPGAAPGQPPASSQARPQVTPPQTATQPAPQAPAQATPQGAPQTTPRTPERAMQDGNAALARRDYPAAEAAAREILQNRTSPRAYDAQFLLAQALAGQRQYPQAAIAYDDTYNRNKRGNYAQDALLGLANALNNINEKRASCDTLTRLATEFPQPRGDLREPINQARQRAGCR
jgi:TolA-binding protein